MEKITKGQFLIFKLLCCRHYAHTENVSRPGHHYLIKNQPHAVPTVEQYTHTKTCASSVCKNTPKNSVVRRAVTLKFTQNAQQTSKLYSRS